MKSALSVALLLTLTTIVPLHAERTAESAITPYVEYPRHVAFLDRIKRGPIGLLFLGDSITDFWPTQGTETWSKFAPYLPADFGISGERTENVLWRITNGELDGIDPKAVVIMIGTNNIGHFNDEEPEWTAAGIKKIVEVVHQKLPSTQIILLGVFPRDKKDSPMRRKVTRINNIISSYDDAKSIHYLDITSKFLDDNGEIPADVMADGLHPTAKGYQIWFDAMWPSLEPYLK